MVCLIVHVLEMKLLKNILLVIALFLVAMPCIHAAEHNHASPSSDRPDQISANHACECHSCHDNTVCMEPFEVEQNLSSTSAVNGASAATDHDWSLERISWGP